MINSKAVGEKTEAILLAEFVKKDYKVLRPFGDNLRYDIVLDTADGFKRVQCKTGRLRGGAVRFAACSTSSNRTKTYKDNYHGSIDFFAVWCYETQKAYLIPIERVGINKCSLRVEPFKKFGNANWLGSRLLYGKDFEL